LLQLDGLAGRVRKYSGEQGECRPEFDHECKESDKCHSHVARIDQSPCMLFSRTDAMNMRIERSANSMA
jgi:hypothetical protein